MPDNPVSEKINLEELGRYLESLGYRVVKLSQEWRHVTGVVKFENEKLFLKMASTHTVGLRTRNEMSWNVLVNSTWRNKIKEFHCPKIFDHGAWKDKFWFVCDIVYGKQIKELGSKNTNISIKDLAAAAKIAKNIIDLTEVSLLPKDIEHLEELWAKRIVSVAKKWSKNVKTQPKMLLDYIQKNADKVQIGVSHGDFTPWHIFKCGVGKYAVIDNEAAQLGGPKFYDVAYFYHRVFTKLKRPDLAEKFLIEFQKIYLMNESDLECFKLVLASRVMGGYFDGERDGVTSIDLNKIIEDKILKGNILD